MTGLLAHSSATNIHHPSATLSSRQRSYHDANALEKTVIAADVNSIDDGLSPLRQQFDQLGQCIREKLATIEANLNILEKEKKIDSLLYKMEHRAVISLLKNLLEELGEQSVLENKALNHFYKEKAHEYAADLAEYINKKLLPLADELLKEDPKPLSKTTQQPSSGEAFKGKDTKETQGLFRTEDSVIEIYKMYHQAMEDKPVIEKLWGEKETLKSSLSAFFALVGFKILRISAISLISNQASVLSTAFRNYFSATLAQFQKTLHQTKGPEILRLDRRSTIKPAQLRMS